ncbi:MAG: hypothetical protein ACRDP1_16125 [Nocardioidaceae bacterium]
MARRRHLGPLWLALSCLATLVISGCGVGAGSATPTVSGSSQTPTATTPSIPNSSSDLSAFACAPDAAGTWNASGVITNPTSQARDYRVTVVVSTAADPAPQGKQRILRQIRTGDPTPFTIKALPVTSGSDPVCQVQVRRQP